MQRVSDGYLNSRQHDSDQVVVGEQQGTDNTAVTHMLDDGWREGGEQNVKAFEGEESVSNFDDHRVWYYISYWKM